MKGRAIRYSAEEMAWLEESRLMVISDYHRAFVERFGRDDVALSHLNQLRKRKGWKVGRDGARYKGRLRTFNSEETKWLSDNRTLPIKEYLAGFQAVFDRPDVTERKLHALRKAQDWKTGRTGKFEKGNEPHNKGKKCPEGVGGRHPNARRTQFKKGNVPHNAQYLGHERVSKDGYVEISVDETNPHTGFERRYVLKHRWVWEKANGPVPDGYALKCLDGNKLNCDPSNWELVERGLLPHLNGGRHRKHLAYDEAAPELRPVVMTQAKLRHRLGKVRRKLSA
ncbi:HNH endonuclease signature motif containing protein [Sphingopyxis flava]|uniref:HNH endonuclease n=1 Tax=Sphingopyxis flava TaxID=1507287 RepID=A0A1T4ZWD6_9SPHN|nr:HNH endonuclease signature motif containing protein [Sphingopyxis flava]SKB27006.1 HNH endonuclease [Sphingopyxis flava]